MNRVVITGMGLITSLGNDKDTTWTNLIDGKCGVGYIDHFDVSDYFVKIGAEIKDFDPEKYGIAKKDLKKLAMYSQLAIAASKMALEDSNFDISKENPFDIGVVVGSGIGGLEIFEKQFVNLMERGLKRVSPFTVPAMIANMSSGNVAIYTGAKGPNKAIVTACATGAHSIGDSFEIIKNGRAKAMICGGTEAAITRLGVAGFSVLRALSNSNDSPQTASRPFTKSRNGFVMGEAAGVLILEELEHAKRRGAKIYAEICGYGETCDAYHITAPDPSADGTAACMQMALNEAGISGDKIDYINAHGTSTPLNDVLETKAIKKVFGKHAYDLLISSTKGATGHCLGASGGIECAFSALALTTGILPPTINLTDPDPECDLNYIPNVAIKKDIEYAMSTSFAFGGQNAALILKKYN